jgi:hypothetical protein
VQVGGISEGVGPQHNADCLWPALPCVEKLFLCAFSERSWIALSLIPFWKWALSVDATEGEFLLALFGHLFEVVVGKAAIIAMVMKNFDAVLGGKVLESSPGIAGIG